MSQETPTSRELARGLIGRGAAGGDTRGPSAAAIHEVCERLYDELSRWVGIDGCYALFSRALSSARIEHPALEQLLVHARADYHLEGVADAARTHGDVAVGDGLETMLVVLIELLGLLIGDDMATTLVLQSTPGNGGPDGAAPGGGRTAQ